MPYNSCAALQNVASASNVSSANIAGSAANASTLAALEAKLCRANDKLQMMEERNQDLTSENAQINILKDTLRDRNNSIKDLKRSLEEKDKARSSGPSDISTDALRIRMADMMNENKTLKQALAAATAGVRGGMERVGK
jgi:predicted RNase H-like nuclease (RuvC/YqgF family)